MAWRWMPGAGVPDWNVASDADADVALALLAAASRWPATGGSYRDAALAILEDLLAHVVVADDAGSPVFLPGAWPISAVPIAGCPDPSYQAPASFRVFHRATGDGRWLQLAESAYDVLERRARRWARHCPRMDPLVVSRSVDTDADQGGLPVGMPFASRGAWRPMRSGSTSRAHVRT